MATYETIYTINSCLKGKEGFVDVKLDMDKAYDRVGLGFLKLVMEKMEFRQRWVSLIIECVFSVSYSVSMNCNSVSYSVSMNGKSQ